MNPCCTCFHLHQHWYTPSILSMGNLLARVGGNVRTTGPIAAVALSCAVLFVAAAPPARADLPATEGVYTYLDEDGVSATWTIRTTCTSSCAAQVTTAPGHGFTAPLVNGRPTVTRTVPDGLTCPTYLLGENGSTWGGGQYPVTVRQSWDPHTLAGEADFLNTPAPCGIFDPHDTFTLTRIG